MGTSELKYWGVTCDGLASYLRIVAMHLVDSCYGNQEKVWQLWATRLARLNPAVVQQMCFVQCYDN